MATGQPPSADEDQCDRKTPATKLGWDCFLNSKSELVLHTFINISTEPCLEMSAAAPVLACRSVWKPLQSYVSLCNQGQRASKCSFEDFEVVDIWLPSRASCFFMVTFTECFEWRSQMFSFHHCEQISAMTQNQIHCKKTKRYQFLLKKKKKVCSIGQNRTQVVLRIKVYFSCVFLTLAVHFWRLFSLFFFFSPTNPMAKCVTSHF